MRRIRTLAGTGRLRTIDRDLGDVDYEIVIWREPRGWKLADGSLFADGPAIVSAFHSNTQVLLDLETGEHLMIEVTQASMAKGQFVVSGPMPRSRRQAAKIKVSQMPAVNVKAGRQLADQGECGPVEAP